MENSKKSDPLCKRILRNDADCDCFSVQGYIFKKHFTYVQSAVRRVRKQAESLDCSVKSMSCRKLTSFKTKYYHIIKNRFLLQEIIFATVFFL